MAARVTQGTLVLTAAQLWHAVTGYVIFIFGGRLLGREAFADFGTVIWTMTTLEILMVDGVPRAVSWYTSRIPEATWGIASRGLTCTLGVGLLLAAVLIGVAPALESFWQADGVTQAVRLSALDFVAFVGFAVLVQAVNGLQRFSTQAAIWFVYSTSKVLLVMGFLYAGWGLTGGVLGYVLASAVGSVAAAVVVVPGIRGLVMRERPGARHLFGLGGPLALQSFALMALVNVDLWAARRSADSTESASDYVAASTLGRAFFFVFRGFADALFPAVTRSLAAGSPKGARRASRKGLGQLACLLLPVCGCATGAATTVVSVLFREEWAAAPQLLLWLAPSSVLWTFTAVFVALVASASRPGMSAWLLLAVLAAECVVIFPWAASAGPLGAAQVSLAAAGLGCLITGYAARRLLGAIIPWEALITAGVFGCIIHSALVLWQPPGIWVFPYGGALWGVAVLALRAGGVFPKPRAARG